MRFEDDICLVTGATGGIGSAVSSRLAEEGARVALHTATQPKEAERLADELPGGPHATFRANLLEEGPVAELVDDVVEAMGGLDVLVNNAGTYEEHPPLDADLDEWRSSWYRTLTLNLQAPADLCHQAARQMAAGDGGAIVNVSSRGAFRGEPTAPAYGASKAGLNALTQSLAKALGSEGISVAAVAPGFVDTPMVDDLLDGERGETIRAQSPLDRVAEPEEVAAAVAYLASDEAEFATGTVIDLNGASYLRT